MSRRRISSRRPDRNTEVIRSVHHRCCARVPENPTRARVITIANSRRGHVADLHPDFSLRRVTSSPMENWTKRFPRENKEKRGAPRRTRTFNPLIKSQMLCRLS